METTCISCKRDIANSKAVSFKCPSCGKETIVRCGHCKSISAHYSCKACNFVGP